MTGLNPATEKYAYPSYTWQEDGKGFYFPDAAMEAFIVRAAPVTRELFETHLLLDKAPGQVSPLNRHRLLIPQPQISWEESIALILGAFNDFDPVLAEKAARITDDPLRWKLVSVEAGGGAGRCICADTEPNPGPFAIIEFEQDGTINDAVYIAHELGHALADDASHWSGKKWHMGEIQAYFTQHILYDFLRAHSNQHLRHAAETHFIGEITRDLYQIPISLGALAAERGFHQGKRIN